MRSDFVWVGIFSAFLIFLNLQTTIHREWVTDQPRDGYAILANQLIHGQLSMPNVPDPKLAALTNPYSPQEREAAHVHFPWDHSYYKGKFYIYFGVVPALLVAAPFQLLTHKSLGDPPLILLFALLTYVFAYLFALQIFCNWKNRRPEPVWNFMIAAALALCTEIGATIQQVSIYQIAIFSSMAFTFGGLWCAARAASRLGTISLAGVLLGLAVGCRPTSLVALLILPGVLSRKTSEYFAFMRGFAPVLLGLAFYNFLRFDNPLETGFFYQLGVTDMTQWHVSFKNEVYAIGAYLFQPMLWISKFPFLRTAIYGSGWLSFRHSYSYEGVNGLLPSAPFLLLCPWIYKSLSPARPPFAPLLGLSGIAALVLSGAAAVYRRYAVGIFPFFVIAGWLVFAGSERLNQSRGAKIISFSLFAYAFVYGFFAALATTP